MSRKDWPRKSGLSLGLGAGVGGGGIGYYLNDSFTGGTAVTGQAATPGPGTRLRITDSGLILSITGGRLVSSGSATGANDPKRIWTGQSRVLGKILAGKFITINNGAITGATFGWFVNNDPTYANNEGGVDYASPGHRMIYAGGNRGTIDASSLGSDYSHALILRGTGLYYLNKVSGSWLLCWIENTGSTATLYPAIVTPAAGRHEISADFIRVPTLLWTPKPISADDFGGTWPTTDGGGLTGLEAGGNGKTWVDNVGVWAIAAGNASCTTDGGVGIATVDSGKSDVYHWAKVTLAGGVVGLVTNYVDANNHVKIYHDGVTTVKVDEVVGGVATNRLTYNNAAIAYAANSALVARGIDGGASKSVYVWYKNVFCNAAATISDATIRAATKHGIYTTNNGNTFSEAFTYAVGSGGEYSNPLNMFIN